MPAPFFIVGASRSGTTLLRLMLNAHSRLAVPDEMKYFRFLEGTNNLETWRAPRSLQAYQQLVSKYVTAHRALVESVPGAVEALRRPTDDRTARGPYRTFLRHWAQTCGKARWGEKTPHNISFVDVIADMFPGAKFVHVARDPRAVVQSMNASSYYAAESVFNALNWRTAIRDGTRLFRGLRADQHLTIRYEDLVCEPTATLRSVCAFLDEAFEPSMLRFYETADQHMAHQIRTPSIRGPVTQSGLSKWRTRLSSTDIALIERLCGEEMTALGYELEADASTVSVPALLKRTYWHWKAWRHRDRRGYEVVFPFLSGLRKRAGSWRKRLPFLGAGLAGPSPRQSP
jgi:LPS sulfotransferase NodH